jgi:hypothetical protein
LGNDPAKSHDIRIDTHRSANHIRVSSTGYQKRFIRQLPPTGNTCSRVPTVYDEYWPHYDQTWKAITWVIVACIVATIEFGSLYIVGTEYVSLPPLYASIVAFLITDLGDLAWLSVRNPE